MASTKQVKFGTYKQLIHAKSLLLKTGQEADQKWLLGLSSTNMQKLIKQLEERKSKMTGVLPKGGKAV